MARPYYKQYTCRALSLYIPPPSPPPYYYDAVRCRPSRGPCKTGPGLRSISNSLLIPGTYSFTPGWDAFCVTATAKDRTDYTLYEGLDLANQMSRKLEVFGRKLEGSLSPFHCFSNEYHQKLITNVQTMSFSLV